MHAGSIIFVEIPVRDLARAADFYAGLFGWSFENDDNVERWYFTSGGRGPMGAITTSRPAGRDGVRLSIAVADVTATVSRAIKLGGGTGDSSSAGVSDIGRHALLIDPDGNRFRIFQGKLGGRHKGRGTPDVHRDRTES